MAKESFRVSRPALTAYLATMIWIALPSGIYLLLGGQALWGVVIVAIAIAALVAAASPQLARPFTERQIPTPRGYVMILGSAAAGLIIALYSLSLTAPSMSTSAYGAIHAVGTLILTAWVVIQLSRSMRQTSEAQHSPRR